MSILLYFVLTLISPVFCNRVEGKNNIIVADDVFNTDDTNGFLSKFADEKVGWSFNNINIQTSEIFLDSNTSKGAFPAESHYWTASLVPGEFFQGDLKNIWDKLGDRVAAHFEIHKEDLKVVRTSAKISSRGDNVQPTISCPLQPEGINAIIVVILVPKWDKNANGEIVVYDERGEILRGIHLLNGRAVIIPCGYNFVLKPPSIDCRERIRSLVFQVSTSKSTIPQLTREEYNAFMTEKHTLHTLQAMQSIPQHNNSRLNVGEYVSRQFKTSRGHPIIVFDEVIPSEMINLLADTMINGIYIDNPPKPDSSDNVQWILGFEVEHIVNSPLWPYVQAIVDYASQKEGYYPYDVSCNNIRSHDTTSIHIDCDSDQDEYTLLIYLNRNWTVDQHGETIFFNYERKEMIYAIRPKYGRVAIFQGTIPHCARPPSPTIHGPRFTLAIKFATSEKEAYMKTVSLDTEPLVQYISKAGHDEAAKTEKVLAEILEGKKTRYEIEEIIRKYEEKLKDL